MSELSCLVRGGPAFGGPGVSPRSDAALVIRFDLKFSYSRIID
jgi:hypothetical protein